MTETEGPSSPITLPRLPDDALVLMVGAAASGKSTIAAQFSEGVVATDEFRRLLGESERDIRVSAEAFDMVAAVVDARLGRGLFTVVDSTALDAGQRTRWLDSAARHRRTVHALVLDTPAEVCRRRNRTRRDPVPAAALDSQLRSMRAIVADPSVLGEMTVHLIRSGPHDAEGALVASPIPASDAPSQATSPPTDAGADGAMRFGLHLSDLSRLTDPSDVMGIAVTAEAAGFDSIWLMDHLWQIPQVGRKWDPMLDPYTTLAAIAARTTTIELGVLVSPVTFRNVVVLAKTMATLDVLSAGRAVCGLGLGWWADEHAAAGLSFPDIAARQQLLRSTASALRALWGPGAKTHDDPRLPLADTTSYPRPVDGTMPILVGGSGEQTLKIAAEVGDACNLFGSPETVAPLVEHFRRCIEAAGVDGGQRRVTHLSTALAAPDAAALGVAVEAVVPARRSAKKFATQINALTTDEHVARVAAFTDAGVDEMIISLADVGIEGSVERFGAVISACRTPGA